MYIGYVVHDRGDFLGWACDKECAEYLVDTATSELNPGDIGLVKRTVSVEHTCNACESPINVHEPAPDAPEA